MNNAMEKHEAFILDTMLPVIMAHARQVKCEPEEAVLAVFMSLSTILLERGFSSSSLLMAIQGSALSTHDAPEGLQ